MAVAARDVGDARKAGRYADFEAAVRAAVASHLPDLQPVLQDVIKYLVLYFGVSGVGALTPRRRLRAALRRGRSTSRGTGTITLG